MSRERLQKVLARAGIASRRGAEELIRQGEVTVNGKVAKLGDKADPERDAIKVGRRRVQPPAGERLYLLLNKPAGYLTTRSDPEGRRTVYDLLPKALERRVFPVGRLDYDTEGLLVLTDDGDFAHKLSHPSFGCTKTYEVKVKGVPSAKTVARLARGIVLEGKRTLPARIEALRSVRGARALEKNSWWQIELTEGRSRQVREMFARVGHPVLRLRRVAIGGVTGGRLAKGSLRELSEAERGRMAGR